MSKIAHRLSLNVALRVAWVITAVFVFTAQSDGGIVGYLGTLRSVANEKFEADFFLQAMTDSVGQDLEFINIDMINSDVNGTPLDPNRVQFQASTVDHDFVEWQGSEQFGATTEFESQISLVAYEGMGTPYNLSPAAFLVGTFTVDYLGLGLVNGDQVTLDITGVDKGLGSRSTSVAIFDPNAFVSVLIDPDFSTSAGPGARTFTLSSGPPPPPPPVVPEPSSLAIALSGILLLGTRRRRRVTLTRSDVQR